MKTAIAVDTLFSRDEATFLLELVLNLFPNSELYTISHKQGGILGTVETRPIVSSFLSHRANTVEKFRKNFWIVPTAVKGIPLHKSIEKVIVLSRGYIHGLNLPPHVDRYLYVVDWDLFDQNRVGWQKLFAPYVNDWREKALRNYLKIAVSSETLKTRLELPNAEVIEPTFRTEEFPFVKDEDHNFLFTHHLVLTQGMEKEDFKTLASFLLGKGETVRILGPDEHLKGLLPENPRLEFGGDHCEATTALYSHQAKVIWDLSNGFFPVRAFGGLCTGRPVVVRDSALNREYLKTGAFFVRDLSNLDFVFGEVEASYLTIDRRSLRRAGLKWNERLFKSRMVKFLNRSAD